MTSLLHRKFRTTAPLRRAGTVCNLAALLILGTGTALAQYPIRTNSMPPNGPPQSPPAMSMPGAGGQVMYFCKPADAVVPLSGSGSGAVSAGGAPDLPTPPTQSPGIVLPPPPANMGNPVLPTPPPQAPWTQPNQAYTSGASSLPSQPASPNFAIPNTNFVPEPSNTTQPRAAYGPLNQPLQASPPLPIPIAAPQATTQPVPPPPEKKQMNPPDPRVLSPEYATTLPPD